MYFWSEKEKKNQKVGPTFINLNKKTLPAFYLTPYTTWDQIYFPIFIENTFHACQWLSSTFWKKKKKKKKNLCLLKILAFSNEPRQAPPDKKWRVPARACDVGDTVI